MMVDEARRITDKLFYTKNIGKIKNNRFKKLKTDNLPNICVKLGFCPKYLVVSLATC